MSHRGPGPQPPGSQEALATLRSLSPGKPADPHTNRGEEAVSIRGRQRCPLSARTDGHLHLRDPCREFQSRGLPSPKPQCWAEG